MTLHVYGAWRDADLGAVLRNNGISAVAGRPFLLCALASDHGDLPKLRRQLAIYQQHRIKPRRIDTATRASLSLLSRLWEANS
jgi:hypothetical protein